MNLFSDAPVKGVRRPAARPGPSAGFTLIEIMVVVVILAILASVVAPAVIKRIDDAQVAKAKSDIRAYETALDYASRAKHCLSAFPPSQERDALIALPDYVVSRDR